MNSFELTELNGVKIIVMLDGTVLKHKNNCWKQAGLSKTVKGYYKIGVGGKMYFHHRVIAFAYLNLDINNKLQEIDHINRIRDDNRVENLRVVSHRENMMNQTCKGYYFHNQSKRWRAQIYVNGKAKHLGNFKTEEEASQAYHRERNEYFRKNK